MCMTVFNFVRRSIHTIKYLISAMLIKATMEVKNTILLSGLATTLSAAVIKLIEETNQKADKSEVG